MRSTFILSLFLVLAFCSSSYSQEIIPAGTPPSAPIMVPGRTMDMNVQKSYPDSVEFNKVFKEFYPLVKPAKSVKEQADQYFQGISRSFKMQDIDSAEAAKAAFKNLDNKAFEKAYYDVYRRNLSAKELKKYMEFIQTPEGKHISEVWMNLQRASNDATMYVAKTINLNLTPLREAGRQKMMKEHPERMGQPAGIAMPPQNNVNLFDQRNAGSKDSLIRSQQLQNRLPKSIDSLSTPRR